jgi:sec-independent protein translocase protein TatC
MAEAPTDTVGDELTDEERREREREAELDASRMPFMEHLVELRRRLRNAIIAVIVGFLVAFGFSQELFVLLARPLVDVWTDLARQNPAVGEPAFVFNSLIEPFWVYLSVALWAGFFLASPFVFLELWKFIAPGLYKHERRYGLGFACCAGALLVAGAAFCYAFVLPAAFHFFLNYSSTNLTEVSRALAGGADAADAVALQPLLGMDAYLSFARRLLLAFGLVFELPLAITFLALIGMVTHRSLLRFARWFIVLAFIIAAVLTPGPDVISQIGMALPMLLLYFLSIGIAYLITRRRERRQT